MAWSKPFALAAGCFLSGTAQSISVRNLMAGVLESRTLDVAHIEDQFLARNAAVSDTPHTLTITTTDAAFCYLQLADVSITGAYDLVPSLLPGAYSDDAGSYPATQCTDGDVNTYCHSTTIAGTLTIEFKGTPTEIVVYNRVDCCPERINGATLQLDGVVLFAFPDAPQMIYNIRVPFSCPADEFITKVSLRAEDNGVNSITSLVCSDGSTVLVDTLVETEGDEFSAISGDGSGTSPGYCKMTYQINDDHVSQLRFTECSGDLDGPFGQIYNSDDSSISCAAGEKLTGLYVTQVSPYVTSIEGICGPIEGFTPSPVPNRTAAPTVPLTLPPGASTSDTVHTLEITTTDATNYNYLSLGEVSIAGGYDLVATLSDTYSDTGGIYYASRCVDGDPITYCHSKTIPGTLTVEFKGTPSEIIVTNRYDGYGDRINGATVALDGVQVYTFPTTYTQMTYNISVISCDCANGTGFGPTLGCTTCTSCAAAYSLSAIGTCEGILTDAPSAAPTTTIPATSSPSATVTPVTPVSSAAPTVALSNTTTLDTFTSASIIACGPVYGVCPTGNCCSANSQCGTSSDHCNKAMCLPLYTPGPLCETDAPLSVWAQSGLAILVGIASTIGATLIVGTIIGVRKRHKRRADARVSWTTSENVSAPLNDAQM